jgi:hypothetical protein
MAPDCSGSPETLAGSRGNTRSQAHAGDIGAGPTTDYDSTTPSCRATPRQEGGEMESKFGAAERSVFQQIICAYHESDT